MRNRTNRGRVELLVVAMAAATLTAPSAMADTVGATGADSASLHILPWSAPSTQKPLIDLLKEHDRKEALASWPRPLESTPGTGLFDAGGPALVEAPTTYHKPIFGTLGTPIGKLSVVSEKLDANGRIKGLDFMRLDVPGWDIGVKGSGLKISHKWGAKGGDHPFRDSEKHSVAMPN